MNSDLPPELAQFTAILDAQPSPVQIAFQYAICLLMDDLAKCALSKRYPAKVGRYVFLR